MSKKRTGSPTELGDSLVKGMKLFLLTLLSAVVGYICIILCILVFDSLFQLTSAMLGSRTAFQQSAPQPSGALEEGLKGSEF
jgi:hypothetical protein